MTLKSLCSWGFIERVHAETLISRYHYNVKVVQRRGINVFTFLL